MLSVRDKIKHHCSTYSRRQELAGKVVDDAGHTRQLNITALRTAVDRKMCIRDSYCDVCKIVYKVVFNILIIDELHQEIFLMMEHMSRIA